MIKLKDKQAFVVHDRSNFSMAHDFQLDRHFCWIDEFYEKSIESREDYVNDYSRALTK